MPNTRSPIYRSFDVRWSSFSVREKFLEACPEYFKPIAIMALNTGRRKNEILNLRRFDIDFDLGEITVREAKGEKVRYLPVNRTLTETLRKVKIRNNSESVFSKEDGSSYQDVGKPFEKALRREGIGKVRFHDSKHAFASQLVMKSVDLAAVKELMGYRSIRVTLRYTNLGQDQKKKAVESLDRHQSQIRGKARSASLM